jgi:PadR family transcriptional regulator PadR
VGHHRTDRATLYPALYRLERQGLIQSEWQVTANNRRARYYSLTRTGRRHFTDELAQWRRMSRAVNLVLDATIDSGVTS